MGQAAATGVPVREEPPAVPGYLVGQRLGTGSTSQVWSALALADRTQVALKVLTIEESLDRVGAGEVALLRALSHPHVVRRCDDLDLPDGRTVLVLELAGGGNLARVVRARGHLLPGEVVTVTTAVATGLAELHRMGVTHADVSPGNVLLHLDGRPVLGDVGRCRVAGERRAAVHGTDGFVDPDVLAGAEPGPASDVYGLGALGCFCLTGRPPSVVPEERANELRNPPTAVPAGLWSAIAAALAPAPEDRPSAAELAHALYRSCPAQPLRLAGDSDPVEELTHRIRRLALEAADREGGRGTGRTTDAGRAAAVGGILRRAWGGAPRTAAATALAVLSLAAALAGTVDAPADADAPAAGHLAGRPVRAAAAAPGPASLQPLVVALAQQRAAAFATHPGSGPGGFDAPGSAAWTADATGLRRLAGQGLHYRGLDLSVGRVQVLASGPTTARVAVTFVSSAYDVVGADGAVRAHVAAEPSRTVELDLVRVTPGWRIERLAAP